MKCKSESFRIQKLFLLLILIFSIGGCKDDIDTSGISTVANKTIGEMNSNIRSLQLLLAAQSEGKTVANCLQISSNCYNIELNDGNSFSVFTSITPLGKKETPVYSPSIGAMKSGTSYYWTYDGSFLMISNKSQKVIGGETPVIGIDNKGYWNFSIGTEIVSTGRKADAGIVRSLFTNVVTSEEGLVTFKLSDAPSSIVLPKSSSSSEIKPIEPTGTLRRPISPENPAWFIHIDTWNTPDPQAIIDLIPADIRPYVVFNISLSVSRGSDGNFNNVANGYETAKSWLRTCAENNVWAMVQGASGGYCHWPDFSDYSQFEGSLFEEFYREYPNFIGFNYAEQGWGFDQNSSTYDERLQHFANLMRLNHEYGGYLVVSFLNPSGASSNSGVAMIKRSSNFADACRKYPENFIACEKFTQTYGFFDMESTSLGLFVSGFAGNYGMRFDQCGWLDAGNESWSNDPDWNGGKCWNGDTEFPPAAGAIPFIEHVTFTGQTVYDGPELIWQQCFKETGAINAGNGYSKRSWEMYDQFVNISMDIYRKIIDGTIRIMSRKEVIDRTKVVVVNDVPPTGAKYDPGYSAPANLFKGLYLMDEDGIQTGHHLFFKKTGRYPTIPTVAELADDVAKSFEYQINASDFKSGMGWDDIDVKRNRFDNIFPEEYISNGMYAGRHENSWVVYNCYADTKTASIPFKYNTSEKMELSFGKYSVAAIKEYTDKVDFYLTNYTTDGRQTDDTLKIYGAVSKPSYSFKNRVPGNSCTVTDSWKDGVFTLSVRHNGALDISVNCSGNAVGRERVYTNSGINPPPGPSDYEGPRQYEAEYFEYKNVAAVVKNAIKTNNSLNGYTALGYLSFGTKAGASIRNNISVSKSGFYTVQIRYSAPETMVSNVGFYVNGNKVSSPQFTVTPQSDAPWQTLSVGQVYLEQGYNTIELTAGTEGNGSLYIDNIILTH